MKRPRGFSKVAAILAKIEDDSEFYSSDDDQENFLPVPKRGSGIKSTDLKKRDTIKTQAKTK